MFRFTINGIERKVYSDYEINLSVLNNGQGKFMIRLQEEEAIPQVNDILIISDSNDTEENSIYTKLRINKVELQRRLIGQPIDVLLTCQQSESLTENRIAICNFTNKTNIEIITSLIARYSQFLIDTSDLPEINYTTFRNQENTLKDCLDKIANDANCTWHVSYREGDTTGTIHFIPFGGEDVQIIETLPLIEPIGRDAGFSNLETKTDNNGMANTQIMICNLISQQYEQIQFSIDTGSFLIYIGNHPEQFQQEIYGFNSVIAVSSGGIEQDLTSFFQMQGEAKLSAIFEIAIGGKGIYFKTSYLDTRLQEFRNYDFYTTWKFNVLKIRKVLLQSTTLETTQIDAFSEYEGEPLTLNQALQTMQRMNEITGMQKESIKVTLNNLLWDMDAITIGGNYNIILPYEQTSKRYILKTIKVTNSITSDTTVNFNLEFVTENYLNSQMSELRAKKNWEWNSDIEVMEMLASSEGVIFSEELTLCHNPLLYAGQTNAVPLLYHYTGGYCG